MKYWDELARYERGNFTVIVDKTWDDIPLRDCFDDTCYNIEELEDKVNRGVMDWFMVRVRVLVDTHELGSAYLGGMLYDRAEDCLTDGSVEDLIHEAMEEAKKEVWPLMRKLQAINAELEAVA